VYIYKNICPVLITFGKISDYLFERILKELDMSRHREDQILKELEEMMFPHLQGWLSKQLYRKSWLWT